MSTQTNPHRNAETVVKCPVEGCKAEKLSRGMHLHVLRSAGDGHGPQGEVPEHLDFESLEKAGTREVEVNYPEERKTESVARLCPYCGTPFKGKNGVLIHLGQVEGRKNHPTNASEIHEPRDFPVVELDEGENVVGVVSSRPPASSDSDAVQQDADETGMFAEFSKEEIDHLYEVVHSETDNKQAQTILQRAYINSGK